MLTVYEKVFHSYISGTQNVYTDAQFAELLGSVERLSFIGKIIQVTGTSPTLTMQIEHSPDGARWQNQNATPELNGLGIGGGSGLPTFSSSTSGVPKSNFVRLRITLGGTSPAGLLWLHAIGRSPAW